MYDTFNGIQTVPSVSYIKAKNHCPRTDSVVLLSHPTGTSTLFVPSAYWLLPPLRRSSKGDARILAYPSNHIGQISYDFPLVVSPNITFLNSHPVINLSTGLLASLLPYPPHPVTAKPQIHSDLLGSRWSAVPFSAQTLTQMWSHAFRKLQA